MQRIFNAFDAQIEVDKISVFGGGLINDTYRVFNQDPKGMDFLLQRINHEVFKDVEGLMHNMDLVTNHIRMKISNDPYLTGSCDTLAIIRTKEGTTYYQDDSGNYWRLVEFLKGYKSYDYVETPEQAYQGAKAFGQFMMLLDDFPVKSLKETIPGLHDLIKRLDTFRFTVDTGHVDRVKECQTEIAYVLEMADQMCVIENLRKSGKIKDRVTHNDTKFNNVLLKEDLSSHCVIDLDTVMPGIVHYDFGDGVRTCSSTTEEDEKDLSLVEMDMDKFKGFAQGFIETAKSVLEPLEIEYLALSAPLLTYIMGVRFLTDYLAGDVYYKIKHPTHNLDRARCQLRLVQKMMSRQDEMSAIIKSC